MSETFTCPNCGADVPARAKACPACGADEETGWSDERHYDGAGIEDPDDFDYEDWQRREGSLVSRPQIGWWWWAVAVLVLVLTAWWVLGGG